MEWLTLVMWPQRKVITVVRESRAEVMDVRLGESDGQEDHEEGIWFKDWYRHKCCRAVTSLSV